MECTFTEWRPMADHCRSLIYGHRNVMSCCKRRVHLNAFVRNHNACHLADMHTCSIARNMVHYKHGMQYLHWMDHARQNAYISLVLWFVLSLRCHRSVFKDQNPHQSPHYRNISCCRRFASGPICTHSQECGPSPVERHTVFLNRAKGTKYLPPSTATLSLSCIRANNDVFWDE